MSHEIIVINRGEGDGGSAESQVKYTPNHATVPEAEQFKRMKKAHKVLGRLNDYLYGNGADPYPDE